MGFSLQWLLLLQSTGSVVVEHGLSCSKACGIFPTQGSNPCLLHWQVNSLPLSHQEIPGPVHFVFFFFPFIFWPCSLWDLSSPPRIEPRPSAVSGFPGGSNGKESAFNAGDLSSIPGSGRFPAEGSGCPLQYSCLENSMDRGAWQVAVHEVARSRTRLSD